jgi:hypothetical protein
MKMCGTPRRIFCQMLFLMPWGVERPIVEPYSGVRDIMVIPSLKTDEDGWFNLKNQMLALPSMLSEM